MLSNPLQVGVFYQNTHLQSYRGTVSASLKFVLDLLLAEQINKTLILNCADILNQQLSNMQNVYDNFQTCSSINYPSVHVQTG